MGITNLDRTEATLFVAKLFGMDGDYLVKENIAINSYKLHKEDYVYRVPSLTDCSRLWVNYVNSLAGTLRFLPYEKEDMWVTTFTLECEGELEIQEYSKEQFLQETKKRGTFYDTLMELKGIKQAQPIIEIGEGTITLKTICQGEYIGIQIDIPNLTY